MDGTFFKKQCDNNSRNCWCATPEGEKIPGTSVSFNYVEDMARMECEPDENGSFQSDTGEGVVRLRNSNKKSRKGIVSIFHRGEWGFICRDQVDSKLTNVICRQLGFDRAGPIAALRQAPQMKVFLPKYEPSMMASPILCEGNEEKISMCSQSTWALPSNIPCEKDAAVMIQCEYISEAEKKHPSKGEQENAEKELKMKYQFLKQELEIFAAVINGIFASFNLICLFGLCRVIYIIRTSDYEELKERYRQIFDDGGIAWQGFGSLQ